MLDLYTQKKEPVLLQTVQGNYGAPFEFRIMDYDIPAGASAVLAVQKPSNAIATKTGTISGNVVTVKITLQQTLEAGMCTAELRIVSSGVTVQAFPMTLEVVPTGFDPQRELSTDEWQDLNDALATVADAITYGALGTSPLPMSLGGTGKTNLTSIYTVEEATGWITDANDYTFLGALYITDAWASSVAHIPTQEASYLMTLYNSSTYNMQVWFPRANRDDIYVRRLISGTWTAWKKPWVMWSDLSSTPLAPEYGGTGANSLAALMRNGISASSISDANDAPMMSAIYISSGTVAASIANLPFEGPGHLVTIGGEGARGYQFFMLGGNASPRIWVRIKHADWLAWFEMYRAVPAWTTPTYGDGQCTAGGYCQIGKQVHVQMTVQYMQEAGLAPNAGGVVLNGFPAPAAVSGVPILINNSVNRKLFGTITSSGTLVITNFGTNTLTAGTSFQVCGSYFTA